jgi:DNA polymerase (family X)
MTELAMADLDAPRVASLLTELGQRTALRGGNPYRAGAYLRAAENLLALAVPLADLIDAGRLREIPGVGEAIAAIITELYATGTHPALTTLRTEVPAGVLELLSLPGLRPQTALKLYKELGISSLNELEAALRDHQVTKIKGIGPAAARKLRYGLELKARGKRQRHVHRAAELLVQIEENLRTSRPGLRRITAGGDFRRGCELVADLALIAELPEVGGAPESIELSDSSKIYMADEASFGAALLFATGSQDHVRQLAGIAKTHGMALDGEGLREGAKVVAADTEEAIYAALGLPFVEPELREGRGEIELAMAGRLPTLVTNEDLRGVLHVHTDASDGAQSLEQMAEASRKRGYSYLGVADHSQSAGYAGGLSIEAIEAQHRAIDTLNASYDGTFRVFKGIESDILADGSLDYPEHILARFDFVVASVHSRFRLNQAAQTARIVRAVSNPYTTILGHLTGRQLLRRPGYEVDVPVVLAACAKHGVAVEINANPWRLDLDWRWHSTALQLGCMMSINPDAHSTSELDLMRWGVQIARKGGVSKDRVLNAAALSAIAAFFKQRHPRQAPQKRRQPPPRQKHQKLAEGEGLLAGSQSSPRRSR